MDSVAAGEFIVNALVQNSAFLGHAETLRRAVLNLSGAGFLVIRAVADRELFIEIDRPMHGDDVKLFARSGRDFAGCNRLGCNIFWAIENTVNQ